MLLSWSDPFSVGRTTKQTQLDHECLYSIDSQSEMNYNHYYVNMLHVFNEFIHGDNLCFVWQKETEH